MPYLKEVEEELQNAAQISTIERSYAIQDRRTYARPKRKKTSPFQVMVRFVFLVIFTCFVIPYCFGNYIRPIYFGGIANKSLKIQTKTPVYDTIEIHPFLSDTERIESINSLVSPTRNYLNNGSLFGTNFIAKTNTNSKIFNRINSTEHMTTLENRISALAAQYPQLSARVYIYNYSNGKTAEFNSNIPTPLASTVKIPVLFEMFRQIESKNRNISIDKEIIFEDIYRSSGSGDLQYSQANRKYSLDRIAELMITKSDNSATNLILMETGGMENLNRAYRMWGLQSAKISNWLPDLGGTNKMSMREMGDVLYNLDNPKFLSQKSSDKIKNYMGSLPTKHLLRAGIPDGASIIHKTGDIGMSLADCGIVTMQNGKKYIIAVTVERPHNNPKARDLIEEISRAAYNYISSTL